MLKYNIRCLNTAVKYKCYDYKITIPDVIHLPAKLDLLNKQKNKPFVNQNSGNICNECFGIGRVRDKINKLDFALDFGLNLKFTICKKCNGTGFI